MEVQAKILQEEVEQKKQKAADLIWAEHQLNEVYRQQH